MPDRLSSTAQGRGAEREAALFLEKNGHQILDRNWRTAFCEIDIVAKKDQTVYMVEVKFRSRTASGDGFDAITKTKLARMKRAADAWVYMNRYNGLYQLAVIATDPSGAMSLVYIDD